MDYARHLFPWERHEEQELEKGCVRTCTIFALSITRSHSILRIWVERIAYKLARFEGVLPEVSRKACIEWRTRA